MTTFTSAPRIAAVLLAAMLPLAAFAGSKGSSLSAEDALKRVKEGNARYVAGENNFPNTGPDRRAATASGQSPFVTVLSCSDSRVPVELAFDAGVGEVFVIRVAGNVADTDEIGSIEYGINALKSPLLVVLGHSSCGAVTAVVEGADVKAVGDNIPPLLDNIVPAAMKARQMHPEAEGSELVMHAVGLNVWKSIEDLLTRSDAARALVRDGGLKIVGAVYDLASGKVEFMGEHPKQDKLIGG